MIQALLTLAEEQQVDITMKTVGILGFGHTGQAVAKCLDACGVSYVIYDPFLKDIESTHLSDYLAQIDVLSLHVLLRAQAYTPHST